MLHLGEADARGVGRRPPVFGRERLGHAALRLLQRDGLGARRDFARARVFAQGRSAAPAEARAGKDVRATTRASLLHPYFRNRQDLNSREGGANHLGAERGARLRTTTVPAIRSWSARPFESNAEIRKPRPSVSAVRA